MAVLKYWKNGGSEWEEVGTSVDGEGYVPNTGGTIDGPFPLVISPGPAIRGTPALDVRQQIDAWGITTTHDGVLDMSIRLFNWASVDFGGTELKNASSSVAEDGGVTKYAVDGTVSAWTIETFTLGPTWQPASATKPALRDPMVRRNREGLILLGGLVSCTSDIAPGPGQLLMTLNANCRPPYKQVYSTFCTVYGATYMTVEINTLGEVWILQAPNFLVTGTVISLDGISFYET